MKTKNTTYAAFLAAVTIIITLFLSLLGGQIMPAYAATSAASFVLDDLRKDEKFDASAFELKANDHSLQVIQIAESTDKELLLYVYQPSGAVRNFKASSVNISTDNAEETHHKYANYAVEYLNSSGVFFKYKVKSFTVSAAETRYYDISSILRPWDRFFDDTVPGQQDNEVAYEVGQQWTVTTTADGVEYKYINIDTVEITKKCVGYVAYLDGIDIFELNGQKTLNYFVAFSTDYDIKYLFEADVYYETQHKTWGKCGGEACAVHSYGARYNVKYGEKVPQEPALLEYTQKDSNPGNTGLWGNSYTWDKIERTEDFLKNENNEDYVITTEGEESLEGTQWVLRFFTSKYTVAVDNILSRHISCAADVATNVMILRLKFEDGEGKTYDLGVVDNKTTSTGGSFNEPVNPPEKKFAWSLTLTILAIVGVVLVVGVIVIIVLCFVFPDFGLIVWTGVKNVCKVIAMPFKAIAAAIRKHNEEKALKAPKVKSAKVKQTKAKPAKVKAAKSAKSSRAGATKTPKVKPIKGKSL